MTSRIRPETFRHVFGHLPTGVTVITAGAGERMVGMAANSVTSVSLTPPLVLLCPARSSETWPVIRQAEAFCINILGQHHEEFCRQFSRKGTDRFAGVAWHQRRCGPGLDGAAAWIDCRIRDEHHAGDHTIVVAEVLEMEAAGAAAPLVFCRGRYGTFHEHRSPVI
jgi:flavin reductase (DIM6/NTAB) family NADH-FMN oxidoreductase RutF